MTPIEIITNLARPRQFYIIHHPQIKPTTLNGTELRSQFTLQYSAVKVKEDEEYSFDMVLLRGKKVYINKRENKTISPYIYVVDDNIKKMILEALKTFENGEYERLDGEPEMLDRYEDDLVRCTVFAEEKDVTSIYGEVLV
ncbi:hypothetical protein [Carboxylicivirga sp. N1Y90]|uniref:hypothetical protein n=1 Tax=Carboxylicivirga fragile TaxID=3417571 RepID=UPI003D33D825|nr:hypothetical protein [Marinilabiliaceae bacterium N1Y90]